MSNVREKILVAMSGGVDSSVAALLLHRAGFDVTGVSMNLVSCHRPTERSCCSAADRLDARRVCDQLGIPHVSLDYREQFRQQVIVPFVQEYARGRTPIPCALCNQELKFKALFNDMHRMGASCVATGHYARIRRDSDGGVHLHRGADRSKDQSYYLFALSQCELSRLSFPLADLTKTQVRQLAQEIGLETADKPESQEICFVTDDDYAGFVERHADMDLAGAGDFVDVHGNVLGRHCGIHAYTVGQRRGLGIAIGQRQYVVEIRPESNQVVLGTDDDLLSDRMIVSQVSWTVGSDYALSQPKITAQIRARHSAAEAQLTVLADDCVQAKFVEPQRAITPGQAAVFYSGDEVLGGGWIQ